jgi:DNA primase
MSTAPTSRLDPGVIEEIRQRADIVDIISRHVSLKRTGFRYKGLCPFHSEKTPSFTVSPDKQIYKCFGCGAAGNVISFLMNHNQQSFMDVIQELAQQTGVRLVFSESFAQSEQFRNVLRRINLEAAQYFEWLLHHPLHGEEGRAYLEKRQISPDMQKRFQLGFTLNRWTQLYDHLHGQGFSREELSQSGLFRQKEGSQSLYDLFRYRLIFPIVSVNGEILGFGGRALEPEAPAKYINSPETELYQKGQHVYGLHLAKKEIRARDQALLMEGYLDVITAHQYGFEHAVAGLGTALTPMQARQILRFTDSQQILMCYDADQAGQKAADRGADVLSEVSADLSLQIRVVAIPDQEDPDTFLHSQGAQAFQQAIENAVPLMEFRINRALKGLSLNSTLDKALAARAAIQILKTIQLPVYREECIRLVAARLQIEEGPLREQLNQEMRRRKKMTPASTRTSSSGDKNAENPWSAFISSGEHDKLYGSESGLLYLMLQYPEHRAQTAQVLGELVFADPWHEYLRQYLLELQGQGYQFEWQQLFAVFPDPGIHQRLVDLMESEPLKGLNFNKSLADFVRNVKLECLNRDISALTKQIQQAEATRDHSTYMNLMQDYMEKTKAQAQLRQKNI